MIPVCGGVGNPRISPLGGGTPSAGRIGYVYGADRPIDLADIVDEFFVFCCSGINDQTARQKFINLGLGEFCSGARTASRPGPPAPLVPMLPIDTLKIPSHYLGRD